MADETRDDTTHDGDPSTHRVAISRRLLPRVFFFSKRECNIRDGLVSGSCDPRSLRVSDSEYICALEIHVVDMRLLTELKLMSS